MSERQRAHQPEGPRGCAAGGPVVHALSFDIEDWFHMVDVPAVANPADWDSLPSLVERYTDVILECLDEEHTKATFFILGWIADRHPDLVGRIASAGHEIGCHSYWHRRVEELDPAEFRRDTRRAVEAIRRAATVDVRGYRAPGFSITPGCEWAFDMLLELGFKYDASLFPARHGHGGYPCTHEIHEFGPTPEGKSIREFPMSLLRLGPLKMPFSGGGYFRALPLSVIRLGFDRLASCGMPAIVYLHPRDLAPDTPRISMPLHRRIKCYTGLGATRRKLETLLREYEFAPCAHILRIAGDTRAGSRPASMTP